MVEKIDQVAGAADVSAERADGFRKSSDLDIHASVDVEMIDGAAAVAAENAGGVGVVDHHDGAVFFCEVAQARERADVAVHGEDAIGDEQLFAGLVFHAGEFFFGVGDVLVFEDENLGARETRTVDDGGMVQSIRDDEIFLAQNRGDGAGVGGESGLKDHAGFDVLEAGNLFLQLHVDLHGSGDGAHRSGSDAVFARGFECGLAQLGMRGQSQIIVGSEIDDSFAVEGADGGLFVVEHAELEMRALGFEVVELVSEIGKRVRVAG